MFPFRNAPRLCVDLCRPTERGYTRKAVYPLEVSSATLHSVIMTLARDQTRYARLPLTKVKDTTTPISTDSRALDVTEVCRRLIRSDSGLFGIDQGFSSPYHRYMCTLPPPFPSTHMHVCIFFLKRQTDL